MSDIDKLTATIIEGLQEKKGRHIVIADLSNIEETICKRFVIASGGSPSQVQALAQSVGEMLRDKMDTRPIAVDGLRCGWWVAMDYSDVIVHIFLPEQRDFYDLEHLWADAPLTEIPEED